MPQTKSAAKELRKTKRRTIKNDKVRANLDFLFRHFKKAVQASDKTKAEEFSKKIIQAIDKAAKSNVIKKNTAARKKSRMMKKVNALAKK